MNKLHVPLFFLDRVINEFTWKGTLQILKIRRL